MLPLQYRLILLHNSHFKGRPFHSKHFLLLVNHNQLNHPRFAVVIKKSIIKSSVKRNYLKRRFHALFLEKLPTLLPQDQLLIYRSAGDELDINQALEALIYLWSSFSKSTAS